MPLIGYVARLFPNEWRPFVQELEFAREHNFEAVHISDRKGKLLESHLGDTFSRVAEVRAETARVVTMEILSFLRPDGRNEAGATPIEMLRANLPAITTLPIRYVHWHVAPTERLAPADARALEEDCIAQFRAGVDLAAEHGFTLGFEQNTVFAGIFHNPDICRHVLEQVPEIGFVWDTNHTSPEHLDGYLELAPRMVMLHVSDTPLPEVNYHLPLGRGSIDFDQIGKTLNAAHFTGAAILEIGGLPYKGGVGTDTDEALVDSADRLRAALSAGATLGGI